MQRDDWVKKFNEGELIIWVITTLVLFNRKVIEIEFW
jgi:hypothetical protein